MCVFFWIAGCERGSKSNKCRPNQNFTEALSCISNRLLCALMLDVLRVSVKRSPVLNVANNRTLGYDMIGSCPEVAGSERRFTNDFV